MKNFALLALVFSLFSLGACKHEHGTGDLTVHIQSPLNNSVVSNAASVSVVVHFTAEHELEEVVLNLVVDSTNATVAPFPISRHEHNKTLEISETVNLSSYPAGTRFRLEAKACRNHNDNCAEFVQEVSRFTLP
jgi:hypothetical protein